MREKNKNNAKLVLIIARAAIAVFVIVIIISVIANMASSLEEMMHIRRCNRLLGFAAGLLEAACAVLTMTVAVKLLVDGTSGQMLLFNEPTIEATQLFKWLYQKI